MKDSQQANAAGKVRKPAPPLNVSSLSNPKLFARIYNGEFKTIEKIALNTNSQGELAMQLRLAVSSWHDIYSLKCGRELDRVPTTTIVYSEYDIDENGWRTSVNRKTGESRVRNSFLSVYNKATSGITGLGLLAAFGGNYMSYSTSMVYDVEKLIQTHGCKSPTFLQLEDNLHRLYAGQPPVQAGWPGIQGIPDFAPLCKQPDILGGKLQSDKACRCVYDVLQAASEDGIAHIEFQRNEAAFISVIMGRANTSGKVQACLK